MKKLAHVGLCTLLALLGIGAARLYAHDARPYASATQAPAATGAKPASVPGISGQGKLKFRVLYTSEHLPEEARKVLVKAHGGFAVDRRPGEIGLGARHAIFQGMGETKIEKLAPVGAGCF